MTGLNAAHRSPGSVRFSNVALALSLQTLPPGHTLPPVNKYANTDSGVQTLAVGYDGYTPQRGKSVLV